MPDKEYKITVVRILSELREHRKLKSEKDVLIKREGQQELETMKKDQTNSGTKDYNN